MYAATGPGYLLDGWATLGGHMSSSVSGATVIHCRTTRSGNTRGAQSRK